MDNDTFVYPLYSVPSGKTLTLIFTLVQFTYGLISLTLMIFFLIFLRNYKYSFYRVVQLDLLTNVFCHLNSWISIRLPAFHLGVYFLTSLENVLPGLQTVCQVLIPFFLHMQFCSGISLSIHRLTSVHFHTSHDRFWSKWYIPLGLLYVAYSFLPMIYVRSTVTVYLDNGILMGRLKWEGAQKTFLVTSVGSVLYFFLFLVIGLSTAFCVSKKVRDVNISDNGIGRKLTKIALTYCIIFSGILVWNVLFALNSVLSFLPEVFVSYSYDMMMFASDMMTLALPYILLVFDNNVRRDLICFRERDDSRMFISSSGPNS